MCMGKKIAIGIMILCVVALGWLLMRKSYPVTYDNKDCYRGAKDSYRCGSTVRLQVMLATDTDYKFYVDGADFSLDYEDNSVIISFTMPKQEVHVWFEAHNSMIMPVEDE